eukprot:TRINITY_DN8942_c0_g4_i1.p1 TRINITY_DN8942_c0_g4~~TRINITY_DN8942_c0_g4_i1.p1  ORF type:complete len:732 (-),score=116.39 TRINITY_DN8942_c0_g4_i1:371-2566(-)
MPRSGCVGSNTELHNLLGEVKGRLREKSGIVGLPMPQFVLIGRQSVGKSRLLEAIAGETFNFISGTLGTRSPTVLEFRNVVKHTGPKWHLRNRNTMEWMPLSNKEVMVDVGKAHEELGETVSSDPIHVRVESPTCVDMQIVDLPGFRDIDMNESNRAVHNIVDHLAEVYMRDKNNVMLCVEQAGDASTLSTLQKCHEFDPGFERTILIRTKLDKYYDDLTSVNVNEWVVGHQRFSDDLTRPPRFAFTLPFWYDGQTCPKPFAQLRAEKSHGDVSTMKSKGVAEPYMKYVGFNNFIAHMEQKIEAMFSEAIGAVLSNLMVLKINTDRESSNLKVEMREANPERISSAARECGISFASALTYVMEGVLDLQPAISLADELRAFHKYHEQVGSTHVCLLPSDDFSGLDDYISYLRDDVQVAGFDAEVNGGAQFRRLMSEVEIFLRFSEIATETTKRDVIQARGTSMDSLTWRNVVVKLLCNDAHLPLQRRVAYVGERIRWFFETQKESVLNFMDSLQNQPSEKMHSPLYPKHAMLIKQNETIKQLLFRTYDAVCARQFQQFVELFDNILISTLSNPWVFVKGAIDVAIKDDSEDAVCLSFEEIRGRLPKEIISHADTGSPWCQWLKDIPSEPHKIDEAVEKIQILLLNTYGCIRSQVCDQIELFAESFFKLPMLRRLQEDMGSIELSEADKNKYEARRKQVSSQISCAQNCLADVVYCIERLQAFKFKQEVRDD